MDTAVATGAFTLGGVMLGAGINWLREVGVRRRAAAAQLDETFTALGTACLRLLAETDIIRHLGTRGVRARQFLYGLMESEARQPFSPEPGDDWVPEARRVMAAGLVNGLRYMSPVNVIDSLRSNLLPIRSEIAVLAIRLSMSADKRVKAATERVSDAAGVLVDRIDERDRNYSRRQEELRTALGQLRRARDASSVHWWRPLKRRKLRHAVARP